jgi:WD40 repeat protein
MILVGHSMGGLVVKKAYILSHQNREFETLARRIFAIFFLATPHQGAGIADTLARILSIAPGSRPFVQDLSPTSPVLQSINEEFPNYSDNLKLFSFFEIEPMKIGIVAKLIVEKHCAVMNYPNERRTYLNANHRNVAQFSQQTDPSYLAVRNALATTIASKRSLEESLRRKAGLEQLEILNTFLGMSDLPNDELECQSLRLSETCDWILERESFEEWRSASTSKTFWLRGRPGAGKSVLSAHIISHLQESGHDCCFYFFVHGDNTKATINVFLRSMAWQMAMQHPAILDIVLETAGDTQAMAMNKVDHVAVWRRLYLSGILKSRLERPQYWVIDALDECKGGSELMAFLMKMQEIWPLCLLITSRDPVGSYVNTTNQNFDVISEMIEEDQTKKDIAKYLDFYQDQLPAIGEEREVMRKEILESSNGCFLWVTLVLRDLRQVHTATEIRKVLSSNTADMDEMYGRILRDMANARFGKGLAKAILTWTTFSFRFLTTDELHCAIELDLNDTIDDIERSISACCGNLIYVDKSKKVKLLHLTVREFLTRQGKESEFNFDRASAHKRLALVCLRYLSRNERRPSRLRKLSAVQVQEKPRLADYACEYVFQHINHVTSTDSEVLGALAKFMGSEAVLSWIEHLATKGDLERLYQAGKAISNLLNRLAQHSPLLGLRKDLTLLQGWGDDLVHLVTKFGKELSFSPSAIHYLIPPFCPIDSAPYRQFATAHRGLSVYSQTSTGWQDCLSILNYAKPARPLVVAVSQHLFAIGMSNGKIIIYDDVTFQETYVLEHREPVHALIFSEKATMCASAGAKYIRVWELSDWSEKFSVQTPSMSLSLTFAEDDMILIAALKNNEAVCWHVESGKAVGSSIDWTAELDELQSRQPTMATFCRQINLLAVVYRGEDIVLWDYDQDRLHDVYEKESGSTLHGYTKISEGATTVWSLVFSTLGEEFLLAAAYSDGDLVIYNISDGSVRKIVQSVNAQRISCSPDGRTLACADSHGTVQLFDLVTSKLLYRLEFEGDAVPPRALAFTSDSYRIIDIRSSQCRLWDPVVLLRQDVDDENSDTVSVSTAPQEVTFQGSMSIHITTMEYVPSASIVFCGKEDGSVYVYDISREPHGNELFAQTANVPIILLHFNAVTGHLVCSDAASRVTVRLARRKQRNTWKTEDPIINIRVGKGITSILTSPNSSWCLASSDHLTYIWPLAQDQTELPVTEKRFEERGQWIQHGQRPENLIFVTATAAHIYEWSTMDHVRTVLLTALSGPFTAISRIIPLRHPSYFAAVAVDPLRAQSVQNVIHIYNFNDFSKDAPSGEYVQTLGTLSLSVNTVVGVFGNRLLFLDVNNWVCSIGLGAADATCSRHFFIPNDWVSLVQKLMLDVGLNGEILFVKRADIAVIRRGLEMTDKGILFPRKKSMNPKSSDFPILPFRSTSR